MEAYHLPPLIRDLAIILMTAGVTSIICRWLKQPIILGYVIAGILVGPKVSFTATVADIESVKVWGEIGVIFVLFSLGLEFSFRRLMHVGGPAAITAGIETAILLALGTFFGLALGWSQMDALFLGGMLCISSTMIIVKVFEELGLKERHFAGFVLGILIVEDLVAVLLLVLLSTVAVTRELGGPDLVLAALRLGFFLILWFVVGIFVLPGLMRFLKKFFNEETTLIFSAGLCLMMVLVATSAGFSPALGAFVMGSLLAETEEGPRVERVLESLRHFFGAVFFVSVGILFDPQVFLSQWPVVLGVTALLIVGKTFAVTAGSLVSGRPLKTAIYSGLSMTQIGEFSFIIASLGLTLKVVSERLFPIAVGVSLLSSCLTPFLLRRAEGLHGWLERNLPGKWLRAAEKYQSAVQTTQGDKISSALARAYAPLILINLVLVLAMTGVSRTVLYPQIEFLLGPSSRARLVGLLVDLLLCSPFFWGLCLRRPNKKWRDRASQYPALRWVETVIAVSRIALTGVLFLVVVAQYTSWRTVSGVSVSVFLFFVFVLYQYGGSFYRRLEKRFLGQFQKSDDPVVEVPLLPWDTHLTELVVAADSVVCGLTIEKLGLNESFGLMIAAIDRGHRRIMAPRGTEMVFPGDRLSVIGDDAGIDRFRGLLSSENPNLDFERPLSLQSIVLDPSSSLCGLLLKESGLRDRVGGLLVGLEREGYRRLNPPADLRLAAGDRLWIVGDGDRIASLNN